MRRMRSPAAVTLALTLCWAPLRSLAVDPFVTDDARVNEPGQCQLESYALLQKREPARGAGFTLGCTLRSLFTQSEFAVSANRMTQTSETGERGVDKALGLQWKALIRPLEDEAGSWSLGASIGTTRNHPDQQAAVWHPRFKLIASAMPHASLALHANLGRLRDRHVDVHVRTWGASMEWSVSEKLMLVTEQYRQDIHRPARQFGLRYAAIPGRMEIDLLGGHETGDAPRRRWHSAGLRLFF